MLQKIKEFPFGVFWTWNTYSLFIDDFVMSFVQKKKKMGIDGKAMDKGQCDHD